MNFFHILTRSSKRLQASNGQSTFAQPASAAAKGPQLQKHSEQPPTSVHAERNASPELHSGSSNPLPQSGGSNVVALTTSSLYAEALVRQEQQGEAELDSSMPMPLATGTQDLIASNSWALPASRAMPGTSGVQGPARSPAATSTAEHGATTRSSASEHATRGTEVAAGPQEVSQAPSLPPKVVSLRFNGQPRQVSTTAEIEAALGRKWRGMLTGLVAPDAAEQFIPLDLTCAQTALLVTAELMDSPHFKQVKNTIESAWLFAVTHVLVAPAAVVKEVYASCTNDIMHRRVPVVDEKGRYVQVYDDILHAAIQACASDIHFITQHAEGEVRLRVDGQYRNWLRINPELMIHALSAAFGSRIKTSTASKEQFNSAVSMSFITTQVIDGRQWDGRYNGRPHATGYKGVIRLLESSVKKESVPTLVKLGYNPSHQRMISAALARSWGLIAIVGPTGSGKSTTLRTFVVHMPRASYVVRYSCESPVEYEIPDVMQFSLPVDVHMDREEMARKFVALLRDTMRMDPDVLIVGEVRDAETAALVCEFTMSGHRCFTSWHGESSIDGLVRAAGGELRMSDDFLGSQKGINAILYQKLLPRLCLHCRVPATGAGGLSASKRNTLRHKFGLDAGTMFVANPSGCKHCTPSIPGLSANGTHGQIVAAEIFMPDAGMRSLISARNWVALTEAWRGSRRTGFADADMQGKTAFEHGLWLASQGVVSVHDLEEACETLEAYEIFRIPSVDGAIQ